MSGVSGPAVAALLERLGITHVVTVPDSTIGPWDDAITGAGIHMLRVCREGEAWGAAMGLFLGGQHPLVMIQCTGLFESGDALRNVVHDWKLPIPSIIGYRSFLNQDTLPGDTCLVYTEPVLKAWDIDFLLVSDGEELEKGLRHLDRCRSVGIAGCLLIGEGKA
jgi:sulfopyruvate decarboxylase subunit alpha